LGKEHLLSVLEHVERSKYPLFILETSGILFGADKDYVKRVAEFASKPYVRVSFKAATPEGFTQRAGAMVNTLNSRLKRYDIFWTKESTLELQP